MTVNDSLIDAEDALAKAGVEAPRLTAESLMAKALCTGRAGVCARLRDELPDALVDTFFQMVGRRAAREPLQHITGRREFYGLDFEVTPDTLIPRPETELLVDFGIARLAGVEDALAADIGTGSGCVAVSLAAGLPSLTVYAVDSSAPAIGVARRNALKHGVAGRVVFLKGDLCVPLEVEGLEGRLDLIASNPPYVPTGDIAGLQPEVQREPMSALDGGVDGLDVVRRILTDAPVYLKPGGWLAMEIGLGQSDAVKGLVDKTAGLEFIEFVRDFQGIERVVVTRKQ